MCEPKRGEVRAAVNWEVMLAVLVMLLFFSRRFAAGQHLSEVLFSQSTSTADSGSPSVSPLPLHVVVGSGVIASGALEARISVAAQQADNGLALGIVAVYLDFGSGLGKITAQQQVTCLEVSGKFAWIGATVTHSTNGDVIPVGTTTMTFINSRR